MTGEFDRETAVVGLGDGRYRARLNGRWDVGDKPNGGYLAAIVARAMVTAGFQPDPLSLTVHYLRPPATGEVSLAVEQVRAGRAHVTLAARMDQDGTERLRALAVLGDLGRGGGPEVALVEPPRLTPLEEAVPGRPRLPGGVFVSLTERFDLRFDPRTLAWASGKPSGRGEIAAWVRFADGREPDPLSLLLVVDALPPAAFDLGLGGWVPTLELTTHVRARPAPGWLRVRVRTRLVAGGYLEEDAEVWDSRDTLVAMSRQLALAPRLPG